MEIEKTKAIIEAILFAAGRIVTEEELMLNLELSKESLQTIIQSMQEDSINRGIEIIRVDNGYQMCSKKEYHEYIYPIIDKRNKPRLSNAALETVAIIAYNPKVTRAEIEAIRGVNSDGAIYKLLEFGLIEVAGKLDAPGKPTTYKTTNEFLRMFGYTSLNDLPELPRYKLDENQQIVIDELIEEKPVAEEDMQNSEDLEENAEERQTTEENTQNLGNEEEGLEESTNVKESNAQEAPSPEREEDRK